MFHPLAPVHVAITRRVRAGHEAEFQESLRQFLRDSFAAPGVLGASLILPAPGTGSRELGILRTFASDADRQRFYESALFNDWNNSVAHMSEGEAEIRDLHGLEAWFRNPLAPRPPRWKMAVATLCGVFPTSFALSSLLVALAPTWPLAVRSLTMSVLMVLMLTWGVMPVITRVLEPWLHGRAAN